MRFSLLLKDVFQHLSSWTFTWQNIADDERGKTEIPWDGVSKNNLGRKTTIFGSFLFVGEKAAEENKLQTLFVQLRAKLRPTGHPSHEATSLETCSLAQHLPQRLVWQGARVHKY